MTLMGKSWARTVASCLVPFAFFLVVDGLFFSVPFTADHFPVSLDFAFAPVICLYLGWPAMVGCGAAEAIVCLVTPGVVFDPPLWFLGIAIYLCLPYLLWYLVHRKSEDPFPRCSRAGDLASLFGFLILATILYAFAMAGSASAVDSGDYAWAVLTDAMIMMSITLTLGIMLMLWFVASPIEPRAPRWVTVPYEQAASLSLTQRIVLVFSALASVSLMGLLLSLYVFIYPSDSTDPIDFLELIAAGLLLADVLVALLWLFGVLTINYLQSRFTIPIERLSETTRAFPADMANYQRAVDDGLGGEALAEAKAKAEDPVSMERLKPSGEVAYLVEDTDTMRASMVSYLDEVRSVTAENERVKAELDIASQIQQGAVPHDFSEIWSQLGVQVAASMTPARDVEAATSTTPSRWIRPTWA